jgi:predicted nuclease of predicted toxin-antitoxin system
VDVRVAEGLRIRGVKAFSAIERGLIGKADIEHFKYAAELQAVIFTHDHHFLQIAKKLTENWKYGTLGLSKNFLFVTLNLFQGLITH